MKVVPLKPEDFVDITPIIQLKEEHMDATRYYASFMDLKTLYLEEAKKRGYTVTQEDDAPTPEKSEPTPPDKVTLTWDAVLGTSGYTVEFTSRADYDAALSNRGKV
jgi:hypothetical protein